MTVVNRGLNIGADTKTAMLLPLYQMTELVKLDKQKLFAEWQKF